MKKFLSIILLSLLVLVPYGPARAEILEVKSMASVTRLIDRGTVVVFDIDNTLIEPVQSLGNDPWFSYTLKAFIENGDLKEVALKKTIALWQQVNLVTRVKPVEQGTPYFIHRLQEAQIKVIALTSRSSDFAPVTERQLAQVKIDFSKNPVGGLGDLMVSPGVRYRRGVVSVSGQDKGAVLLKLLQNYNVSASKIVFVDDQLKNVQSVDEALANHFSNDSVRYGFQDEKVRHFDSRITDLEGTIFWANGHLISDQRAETILKGPNAGQVKVHYKN